MTCVDVKAVKIMISHSRRMKAKEKLMISTTVNMTMNAANMMKNITMMKI